MQINIQATNLELTEPLKKYIELKIGGLKKFIKGFDEGGVLAVVEVARLTRHHRHGNVYYAEVNLELPGSMLRVEHSSDDVRKSIDFVKDRLQREIKKYKETH